MLCDRWESMGEWHLSGNNWDKEKIWYGYVEIWVNGRAKGEDKDAYLDLVNQVGFWAFMDMKRG